jgi:hypothetical protein
MWLFTLNDKKRHDEGRALRSDYTEWISWIFAFNLQAVAAAVIADR